MAKMYPSYLPDNVKSPGERALFYKFRDDPETKDWVVLHSLFVADHKERVSGEIDFVVIVPGSGVLCLEVKAGAVSRKEGAWSYGSVEGENTSAVGPFRQASDAMHRMREYVSDQNKSLNGILFYSGVIFTGISFDETSPEWHNWQRADRVSLSRRPVSRICLDILNNAHQLIGQTKSAGWYDARRSRPTEKQTSEILEILRGDFEYYITPGDETKSLEESIKRFTVEQFRALDILEFNERVLFQGPAGTGKTFLALEAAKRNVLSGKRTLLLCYNNLLADWLIRNTSKLSRKYRDLFQVSTLHKFMLSLSGLNFVEGKGADFWERELPNLVIDRCLSGEINVAGFECLVVDEIQDIVLEHYLDVLDLVLEGGIAGGCWAMFGDFERQAIYKSDLSTNGKELIGLLEKRSPHHTKFPLRVNCRNLKSIAIGVELSCHLNPGYSAYLHHESESGIETIFYNSNFSQMTVLRNVVHNLKTKDKFGMDDVVVLSSKRDEDCLAYCVEITDGKEEYAPLRHSSRGKGLIRYCTIHSFKGLESPVVIVTDINKIRGDQYESLLYVGMSRARVKLILLMHESCKGDWKEILKSTFIVKQI